MDLIKACENLEGKEVAMWYPAPDKLTLFWVGGGDLQIKNGCNTWRIIDQRGNILMSSADLFLLSTDMRSIVYGPIEDFDSVDTDDENEMGELSEKLEAYADQKAREIKDKIEGAVVDFGHCQAEDNNLYDVRIEFNNGIVLEVFSMISPYGCLI